MNGAHVKHLVDLSSMATLAATFAGWLPNIAALLTIIWTAMRIIESSNGQRFIKWLKGKK